MNLPIHIDLSTSENMHRFTLQTESRQQYGLSSAAPVIPGQTRIYYDTTENWNAQPTLLSKRGVIYIYSDKGSVEDDGTAKNVPAIKVGDGTSYLIDMPFVSDEISSDLYAHIQNAAVHVTSAEKEFWNNKSSAFVDPEDTGTLVLSNTQYMLNGGIING